MLVWFPLLWFPPSVATAQGVQGFGTPAGKLPPKSFGNPTAEEALRLRFPRAAANIVGDDLSLASRQIATTDANGDGITTRQEWAESGFSTPRHFFYHDLNGDGLLTLYEHSIGVSNWRLNNERRDRDRTSAEQAARKKRSEESELRPERLLVEPETANPLLVARRQHIQRLSDYLIGVYDTDENGTIDPSEMRREGLPYGSLGGADTDRDGITRNEEIFIWLNHRLPRLSLLTAEFQQYDLDGDGQVSLAELTSRDDENSFDEIGSWDRNGDGLITPQESRSPQEGLSRFENPQSLVLRPGATVVSDLHVSDDIEIEKLSVTVNLHKENDNYTELILISPSGQRVTLFAGEGWQPWRGGPILDGVTFDDEAPAIKEPLRQPPWRKHLRPSDRGKLFSLRGQSTRGRWRLIVRNQNQRIGLLVEWALAITPRPEVAK